MEKLVGSKIYLFDALFPRKSDSSICQVYLNLVNSGLEGPNNRQEVILYAKTNRKCRIKFFPRTLRFRKNRVAKLIKYACNRPTLN